MAKAIRTDKGNYKEKTLPRLTKAQEKELELAREIFYQDMLKLQSECRPKRRSDIILY